MKITQGLFALFVFGVVGSETAAATKKIYQIPLDVSEKIIEGVLKCAAKQGNEAFIVHELKEGRFANDDRTVEALICNNAVNGIGTLTGRINVDFTMKYLFNNDPKIRVAMETCEKDYDKTPVENLRSFLVCLREKSPYKIVV